MELAILPAIAAVAAIIVVGQGTAIAYNRYGYKISRVARRANILMHYGRHVPPPAEMQPLTLFFHAEEKLRESIWKLERISYFIVDESNDNRMPRTAVQILERFHACQREILDLVHRIIDDGALRERADRSYRSSFSNEVRNELGDFSEPVLFSAQVLSRGGNIRGRIEMCNHLRPSAVQLSKSFDKLRKQLMKQSQKDPTLYSNKVTWYLKLFDWSWVAYEREYISRITNTVINDDDPDMVTVTVLFSEAIIAAMKLNLINQEQIDDFEPSLVISLPRLAILFGLHRFRSISTREDTCPKIFKPHVGELNKIQQTLASFSEVELAVLQRMLADTAPDRDDRSVDDDDDDDDDDDVANGDEEEEDEEEEVDVNEEQDMYRQRKLGSMSRKFKSGNFGASASQPRSAAISDRQRAKIQAMFKQIAGIADKLQSGPNNRLFREVLKSVFRLHQTPEELQDINDENDLDAAALRPYCPRMRYHIMQRQDKDIFHCLNRGSILKKTCTNGKIRKRMVWVTDNMQEVMWADRSRKNVRYDTDHVLVRDIQNVEMSSHSNRAFTLVTPRRTLFFEAKSPGCARMWIDGLQILHRYAVMNQ